MGRVSQPLRAAVQRQRVSDAVGEAHGELSDAGDCSPALDGLKGLMILLVVLSHFFDEIPGGIPALAVGGMAIDVLFVLTGFLIGQLVLEKGARDNFFTVYAVRRLCRTMPVYFVCVIAAITAFSVLPLGAVEAGRPLPVWSYLTFTQNLFMAARDSLGQPWLAPTWTIVVALQFYLVAPALLLFTPYRSIVPILLAVAVAAVVFRAGVFALGLSPTAAEVLLPGKLDVLASGIVVAALQHRLRIDWDEYLDALRIAPVAVSALLVGLCTVSLPGQALYEVFGHLLIGLAAAAVLLMMARGLLRMAWLEAAPLLFMGRASYAIFLIHLPVLWIVHGLVFGATPQLTSAAHWGLTLAALVVSVAAGWLLTRFLDKAMTGYGRSWAWSDHARQTTKRGIAAIKPRLGRMVS